ncbi:hypothetical protein M0R45_031419 [Rubus argutus]|uniref:Uncharacterized protein n=1 Tax=Rubus argutus TaxID=59490 RepID=A0AAW1WFT2_RUBAR
MRAIPNFSPNLDFSTWVSKNLYKIITVVAQNIGDTAALLCFQTQAQATKRIQMPQLDEKNIKGIGRERLKGGRCYQLGTPKCHRIGASKLLSSCPLNNNLNWVFGFSDFGVFAL